LNQEKTRLIIFIIYFVLLLIFNFALLNKIQLAQLEKMDVAIIQSFATFLAFDRVHSNWPTQNKKNKVAEET